MRLGALIARTLAKLATQSCSAVESLLRARGGRHTRDSHEFSMLRDVIELLRAQEAGGRLRGLAADGMIDRVRSRPIRLLQHSPRDPDTHTAKPIAPSLRPSTLISTSHKVSLRHISVRVSRRLSAEVSVAFTVRVSGVPAEVDPGREGRCRFLGAIAAFQVRALPACTRRLAPHRAREAFQRTTNAAYKE